MKLIRTQKQQEEEVLHLCAETESERHSLQEFWAKLQKGKNLHGSYADALAFAEVLDDCAALDE